MSLPLPVGRTAVRQFRPTNSYGGPRQSTTPVRSTASHAAASLMPSPRMV